MGRRILHRCKFLDSTPSGVNALAVDPDGQRVLAVGRDNGMIEIRDAFGEWALQKVLFPPARQRECAVQALVWAACGENSAHDQGHLSDDEDAMEADDNDKGEEEETAAAEKKEEAVLESGTVAPSSSDNGPSARAPSRLFSCTASGCIVEWDLAALVPRRVDTVAAAPVLSLAVNGASSHLAAGCADGRILLYSLQGGDFAFVRALSPQETGVVSLAFVADAGGSDLLLAGSSNGVIRAVGTDGRSHGRVTVGEDHTAVIWSIASIPNGFVSGDSRGRTCVWDLDTLTLRIALETHSADVLSVCATRGGSIYAVGVDHKLVQAKLINGEWMIARNKRVHTHDVRAVAVGNDTLITGGVDSTLWVSEIARFEGGLHGRRIRETTDGGLGACAARSVLYSWSRNTVQIWQLGTAPPLTSQIVGEEEVPAVPPHMQPHALIAQLQTSGTAPISACAMSADGTLLAVADARRTRLFRLRAGESPTPIATPRGELPAGRAAAFTPNGTMLVIAGFDQAVYAVSTADWSTLSSHREHAGHGIVSMAVSPSAKYAVTVDAAGGVKVWELDGFTVYGKPLALPTRPLFVDFMGPDRPVFLLESHAVYAFDPVAQVVTEQNKQHRIKQRAKASGLSYPWAFGQTWAVHLESGKSLDCLSVAEDKASIVRFVADLADGSAALVEENSKHRRGELPGALEVKKYAT